MKLTAENYYSTDANIQYLSVSQFKDFVGTYGKRGCEHCAMEKMLGRWDEPPSTALMIGSYVDSYVEGSLDRFKEEHPDVFTKDGLLKAPFQKAEKIIERINRDEYFMKYLSGDKQVIMTGNIAGADWKIKIDSYIEGVAIVDLKVMQSITEIKWVKDLGYLDWVRYWGYDLQGAVYQEIVRQNTGKRLPFYIAGVSKQEEPDIQIIEVTQGYLDEAMYMIEGNVSRIMSVKSGEKEADRCELCDCCRHDRKLSAPISIDQLLVSV